MKENKSLRRFLFNIYSFAFFNKLLLLTPVYAVFMQSYGITDMQLAVLIILLSVGTLITQIPVTWVTNSIGPRRTIIAGQIVKAIGITLWLVWPTFWGFALGMLLWGAQWAIIAVAFEGLIYDELVARNHRAIYARVLSRRNVIQAIAIAMSAMGSLLMLAGYEWVTVASVFTCVISCIFVARINVQTTAVRIQRTQFRKMFRTGIRACGKTPCIFTIMMLSLMVANIAYLDDYLGPIGIQIGLSVEYVGFISFFLLACYALGQIIAPRLKKIKDHFLYASIFIAGGMYVAFSGIYSVPGLWALGLGYMMFGAINILLYSRFQDLVPQTYRSVILSLHNIGTHLVYICTSLIIGLGGSLGSWRYSIFILGVILCALGIWATFFVRDKCSIPESVGGHLPVFDAGGSIRA